MSSNKVWKAAEKPHSGPIFQFQQRKSDTLTYVLKSREIRKNEQLGYSNGLHDALSEQIVGGFWKCWKAKFGSNNNFMSRQVNGLAHKYVIAAKFAVKKLTYRRVVFS